MSEWKCRDIVVVLYPRSTSGRRGAKDLNHLDAYTARGIDEVKGKSRRIRDETRESACSGALTPRYAGELDAAGAVGRICSFSGIEQDNINRMAEGSEERVQAQTDLNQRRAAVDQQFADARAELS